MGNMAGFNTGINPSNMNVPGYYNQMNYGVNPHFNQMNNYGGYMGINLNGGQSFHNAPNSNNFNYQQNSNINPQPTNQKTSNINNTPFDF
jgi:hypothetical protein